MFLKEKNSIYFLMIFLMIFLINCQSPANNEKFFYSLEDLGLIGWKEKGEFETIFAKSLDSRWGYI